MGVIYLEKKRIDELDVVVKNASPAYVTHNIIGGVARTDYKLIETTTPNGASELTIITQNDVVKRMSLEELADTILYYHDQQQLNHNNILDNVCDKPYGVPRLDGFGKIVSTDLPYNAENSSVILYGDGVPTPLSPVGHEKDFYLNITSGILYTWESGTPNWVMIANLKGQKGDDGDPGPKGDKGDQGNVGPGGIQGSRILSGTGVPSDALLGLNGDYYLDTTTSNLYGPKIADAWGAVTFALKGDKGNDGDPGAKGDQGDIGPTGEAGRTILSGPLAEGTPPSNTLGVDGDFFLDFNNYVMYGPKISNAWPTGYSIKSNIYVQASQPTDPKDNTIWFDTTNL